jgi:hypothetical protein
MSIYGSIYSEEDFKKYLGRLNALTSEYTPWQDTKARKEHQDEFGDIIKEGDIYYKRSYGPSYSDVLKLSRRSIEIVIYCLFNGNFSLENIADKIKEARWERLKNAHARYSPVSQLLEETNRRDY